MLRQAERPAVDDAHRFKQSVPKQKTAVVQGNNRLCFGQKMSVEEDNHETPIPNAQ